MSIDDESRADALSRSDATVVVVVVVATVRETPSARRPVLVVVCRLPSFSLSVCPCVVSTKPSIMGHDWSFTPLHTRHARFRSARAVVAAAVRRA